MSPSCVLLLTTLVFSASAQVALPTVNSVSSEGGILDIQLSLEAATHSTSAGTTFETRALNGTIPGPTLRLKPGDTLKIDFHNKLSDQGLGYVHNEFSTPDTTNIHFHGLHVSGELPSDDTTVVIAPGESRRYESQIPADHMPGTHWLHPHRHGSTALQVAGGAALALVVEDPPGSLPAQVEGAPEVLLVLMQVDHEELAEVAEESSDSLYRSQGQQPSFLMINGEEQPTITVNAGEWTRIRLVYAAWLEGDLNFAAEGCEMVLLAKDGVYIRDFPRPISVAPVPAGGRADVMLRCPQPDTQYTVTGWAAEGGGGGGGGGGQRRLQQGDGSGSDSEGDEGGEVGTIAFVQTTAAAAVNSAALAQWSPTYPAYLTDLRATPADSGCACETEFDGGDGDGGAATVNDRPFAYGWFLHQSYLGAVVERSIDADEHPYHQHVHPFQLVSGFAETEYFRFGDWHDTVRGEGVVRYTAADFSGKVMVHCHRLQHEDEGMMAVEFVRSSGPCRCGFAQDEAAPQGGDGGEEEGDGDGAIPAGEGAEEEVEGAGGEESGAERGGAVGCWAAAAALAGLVAPLMITNRD